MMRNMKRTRGSAAFLAVLWGLAGMSARAEFDTESMQKGRLGVHEYPFELMEAVKRPRVLAAPKRKPARALDCPRSAAGAELLRWRDEAVVLATEGNDLEGVKNSIERCYPNGVIPACLRDLYDYSRTTYTAGSNHPEYNDALTVRSERELPEEFWVKDEAGQVREGVFKLPHDLIRLADRKGWKVAAHKTRGQGGFQTGPNLLIIGIPGARHDIFMQIQLPRDAEAEARRFEPEVKIDLPIPLRMDQYRTESTPATHPTTLTLITVDKSKSPAVGQLRFLHRKPGTEEFPWSNTGDYTSCQSCHVTPLRNISPVGYKHTNGDEQRMTRKHEAEVDGVNNLMASHMGLSWGQVEKGDKRIVSFAYSPASHPLGWAPKDSRTRTAEFIASCKTNMSNYTQSVRGPYSASFSMTDSNSIRADKVAQAMNCTMCHNGSMRGPIGEHFSMNEVSFKVLVDRSMPPTMTDLTTDERLALVGCLQAERDAVKAEWAKRGEWMKKVSCQ